MELTFAGLPLPLRITPPAPLSDEALMRFSSEHKGFPVEQDSNGDILVMSPTEVEGSGANVEVVLELQLWNRDMGYPGTVTESNGGYRLPDGSVRAPDAGWIRAERMQSLSRKERRKFFWVRPTLQWSCVRLRIRCANCRKRCTFGSAMACSLPG